MLLREFHKATGKNQQTIKAGDVVLVHDDTPRTTWKLAMIEKLIRGNNGLVRTEDIRTATGNVNTTQHTSQTRISTSTSTAAGLSIEETN